MKRKQQKRTQIKKGMLVVATEGDLGEEDISKPRIEKVERDEHNRVKRVEIEKGVIFKKHIEIPVDRIQEVQPGQGHEDGKVIIDGDEQELEALTAHKTQILATEQEHQQEQKQDLLKQLEQEIPTAEGLRAKERQTRYERKQKQELEQEEEQPVRPDLRFWLRMIGPGFLAGMAGNDSSAVASYSIDGAQAGFGHLWLMLLSTPLYQAVQYACAKLGRITQQGLTTTLREHYGLGITIPATLVLIIANMALITADLVAVSSGFELLTHIAWPWFVVPVGIALWYLVVYSNFNLIKRIFVVLSLAFVAYIITGIMAHPAWGQVLYNTFVPHVALDFASISSAVALLGATISPYNIFWQVQGEKEERRPGTQRQKFRFAAVDVAVGVVSGNLIAYFIILSTAATLFKSHTTITTASGAAQALTPILGPFGAYLFALGLIGSGIVAIPILLASTAYAISGTIGWPAGLSKKPWQSEGFYLIMSVALIICLALVLLRLNPISLLFWANVLNGVLAPILVVYIFILGNNRLIMKGERLSILTNLGLVVTILVMAAAAIMLFYGLFTGS